MKNSSLEMLIMFLPTFVADIKTIYGYIYVAPLKGIWFCSFLGWRISWRKGFRVVSTWEAPGKKLFKKPTVKSGILHKRLLVFFLAMRSLFFIAKFRRVFCTKTIKSRLFKKYLKINTRWHPFVCILVCCYIACWNKQETRHWDHPTSFGKGRWFLIKFVNLVPSVAASYVQRWALCSKHPPNV